MDRKKVIEAVEYLLTALGEDLSREGLVDTPRRVADMYSELLSGSEENVKEHLKKTFTVQSGDIIIESGISFSSMCEHHLMPFFGEIAIAYIPNGKVVGLSKLARVVEEYSHKLQLQEQLTTQIATAIYEGLGAKGVLVVCKAEHTCMTCRGVRKFGSKTTTYKTMGNFPDNKVAEVMGLIK